MKRGFTPEVCVLPGIEQTKHDISGYLSFVSFIRNIKTLVQEYQSESKWWNLLIILMSLPYEYTLL